MSKLTLDDTGMDAIVKLSEGNPGAVMVLCRLLGEGNKIDPQPLHGGVAAMMNLDALGIYGSSIWVLYKDVCRESLVNMIALLRAKQLGLVSAEVIKEALLTGRIELDLDERLKDVWELLPDFTLG